MKSDWKKVKLGDICSKIGSGATPSGGSRVYIDQGVSFIRSQNVYNLNFDYSGLTHITDEAAKKLNGVTLQENDVLLNITGDSVARTCIVPKNVLPARVNQHVSIIRPDQEFITPKYLNYYLASPYMQSVMLGLAVGKGASRNAITKTMIENFEVPCPPLPTQQKIASVLSAYDDLIENNRRQIKLLEEAALKLYKEWFVKLNFPGHETTKIADGVPDGWKKERIDSFVELQNGFAFKSDSFDDEGIYRIITIKNVQDGAFDSNNVSRIKQIPSKMPEWCNLKLGDILLSLTGNVGRVCLVTSANCLLNQRVAKLKSDYPAYTYILFRSKDMFIMMNNLANGAAQQNLSPIRTGEQKILKPAETIIKKFEEITSPCIKKILMLFQQIEILQLARDKLLPKLMNGEIEV